MFKKTKPATEKFAIVPCVGGFRTAPLNAMHYPLLARLHGFHECSWVKTEDVDLSTYVNSLIVAASIDDLIADLKDYARSCSLRIDFLGDPRLPTVKLTDLRLPKTLGTESMGPATADWEIRVQSVYGNATGSQYQLGYVRPAGTEDWWCYSQAPQSLLDALKIDKEFSFTLVGDGGPDKGLWGAVHGKDEEGKVGSLVVHWISKEDHPTDTSRRYAIGRVSLPEPIAAEKVYRRELHATVDLKWGLFYAHPGDWEDGGYAHVIQAMTNLIPGQQIEIYSAPWKEIRHAKVVVRRISKAKWHVSGHCTFSWDDPYELAQTLGVYLTDDFEWQSDEDPEDAVKRCLEEAGDEAYGCHTVSDEDCFRESLEFSQYTMEPGFDWEFDKTVFGGVEKVLRFLSDQENEGYNHDQSAWKQIQEMFSKPEGEE